jgi:hypothetical protein
MEELIQFLLKPRRFLFDNDINEFSTLRTQITDIDVLINALQELGLSVKTDIESRSYYASRQAKVVAVLRGDCDLGWIENANNSDGTLDLIVDLWGVSKFYKPEQLISSINQKYHELKARKDTLS